MCSELFSRGRKKWQRNFRNNKRYLNSGGEYGTREKKRTKHAGICAFSDGGHRCHDRAFDGHEFAVSSDAAEFDERQYWLYGNHVDQAD